MAAQTPDRLLAGEVGKPRGLGGEVYVVPISDDPRRFEPGSRLQREDGSTLTIAASQFHGTRMLLRFEGVEDRDSAESLRGPLYVPVDQTRELEADEFWPFELVGCAVFIGDHQVGAVLEVVPGAAQDLLRVETRAGERLVPFVSDFVVSVDPDARRILIDPPEGLLD